MLLAPAAYPVNAQAAIFSDDEARKAILDLRIRFEELRNQVQDLGKQIQALNTELKETQQVVQKKADGQQKNHDYNVSDQGVQKTVDFFS